MKNSIQAAIFGHLVGDALGVPVEFRTRESIRLDPVTGMRGFGSHNQPAGTWSDDGSLMLCLVEAMARGLELQNLAHRFIAWLDYGHLTAHGDVFDIGNATHQAIQSLKRGVAPTSAGGKTENSNGNGSLMRILPLVFYTRKMLAMDRFKWTQNVSSLTHAHIRSVAACYYYLEFARILLDHPDKWAAYQAANESFSLYFSDRMPGWTESERKGFQRILSGQLATLPEEAIDGSGYVLHTLEASLWCLLTTDSYREAVLRAVNLGSDTDTTGAVTGGLAGLLYGYNSIPEEWVAALARREHIESLVEQLAGVEMPTY